MDRKEMLYYFLSSSMNNKKRLKVTGGSREKLIGYIRDLKKEDSVLTIDIEGEIYVIDMSKSEVKTSLFDHRSIVVNGEESYKFQLY